MIGLYVELYFYLFRLFKNEHIAGWVDILLLSCLQLLNIYSATVIVQKFLSVNLTGYLLHKHLFVILFCCAVVVFNFFASKEAKKTLQKEDIHLLASKKLAGYVILTVILLAISHYIPNKNV